MRIERDGWLAELFGHDVFRVTVTDPAALHDAARNRRLPPHDAVTGQAFYYARVPTAQIGTVRDLVALGFGVVDVNITLSRQPGRVDLPAAQSIAVASARGDQIAALLDIAGSAFIYSRFHLDPLIPEALAHRIKREWVASYARGARGEELLCAVLDGKPAGFLAVLGTAHNDQSCKAIDLIAVGRDCQGQGVGRALVAHFVSRYQGRATLLRVGTQAANVPSLRLYENCGFRVQETAYVLHLHARDGERV